MNKPSLIEEFLAAARSAGIEVRQEALATRDVEAKSGLVRLKGKKVLFLDPGLSDKDKLKKLAEALRGADLENIYLSPAARSLIEGGAAGAGD